MDKKNSFVSLSSKTPPLTRGDTWPNEKFANSCNSHDLTRNRLIIITPINQIGNRIINVTYLINRLIAVTPCFQIKSIRWKLEEKKTMFLSSFSWLEKYITLVLVFLLYVKICHFLRIMLGKMIVMSKSRTSFVPKLTWQWFISLLKVVSLLSPTWSCLSIKYVSLVIWR